MVCHVTLYLDLTERILNFEKNLMFPSSVSGDVVLREEPYAAVLRAIFRVNHCAHCLKKIPTPVPCFECATVRNGSIKY